MDELAEAFSGARLELVKLPAGRSVVLKHLPREGDWLTRATDGAGRVRRLWESGMLARIRPLVDHTIIDVRVVDGHDVVVMRDARGDLLPPRVPVSRATSRALLSGLVGLHDAWEGQAGDGLCGIGARYAMFAPAFHAEPLPGAHPLADRITQGWDLFARHVDHDTATAVFAVHKDPAPLGRRLAAFSPTLLHGDAKLENLGLSREGLVAIDWGDLTGFGPREVDVAWFALKGAARIGRTPDEILADYEAASGRRMEPQALDLACVGSLAQMGFRFAVGAFASGPEPREVAATQLKWWTARVGVALDRLGSL
jgi:Phosphotransferase enzyme family